MLGSVSIRDLQGITLSDFVFAQTISLDNATDITINGNALSDTLDVSLVGSGTSSATVNSGDGDDHVTVRGSHGKVAVTGGAGDDTLTVDFTLDDSSPDLRLSFDGGDGFDSLAIQGGTFDTITYSPLDPNTGSIALDGVNLTYTNIEPIDDLNAADNVTFSGTGGDDTISIVNGNVVTDASTCPDGCQTIEIQSPQFENITFANKTNVTIDGGDGDDNITLDITKASAGLSSLKVQGGDDDDTLTVSNMVANVVLTLDGNDGMDTVIISDNALVCTREISGSDCVNDVSTGDSKDIAILAETITIGDGAKILAHVEDGSSFSAGDITLTASDATFNYTPGIDVADTNAVITINDATIMGGDVNIAASADTSRVLPDSASATEWFTNGLLGVLQSFSLIGGVVVSNSLASILIGVNAIIDASSFSAIAMGTGQAWTYPIGLGLGVAVGVVDNVAKVIVNGQITTTGDTYLRAAVDNTLNVVANTSGLAGVAVAAAVSVLDSEATVHVTDDAVLTVGGDLTVRAETTDRNFTYAVSTTGGNGQVGIAAAVKDEYGVTNAFLDGFATVDGNVTVSASQNRQSINVQKLAVIPANVNGTAAAAGVGTSSTGNLVDDVGSTGFLVIDQKGSIEVFEEPSG